MTDEERLTLALERARVRVKSGIGTQSEKLVHQTLKYFLEPDESCHEVKIGNYTADIFQRETGRIFEIQTRGFDRLREKLSVFLKDYPVTLVYPCTGIKYLNWIDPETGEVGKPHKSPRKGRPSDALPEIYRLMDLWNHENLEILVLMIDMEEFRLQDGYGKDNKHGSHRYERIPLAIDRWVRLKQTKDYIDLLPDALPAAAEEGEIVIQPSYPVSDYVQWLLEPARGELGYHEAKDNSTKYGVWTQDPTAEWCAEFLCWCVNQTDKAFTILPEQRIAQLVISPVINPEIEVVDDLEDTERGSGGFGSTGKK